jgi:hypothetical protein
MARTYWIRHRDSTGDGHSLDAAVLQDGVFKNTSAVEEVNTWDTCIVLPAFETCSGTWYFGPVSVPLRFDRDGGYRQIGITPLASGGSAQTSLFCHLVPVFRAGVSTDDKLEWQVPSGSLTWQTEGTITPSRELYLPRYTLSDAPSGDATDTYLTAFRRALLVFSWQSVSASPKWGGVRIREIVDVS